MGLSSFSSLRFLSLSLSLFLSLSLSLLPSCCLTARVSCGLSIIYYYYYYSNIFTLFWSIPVDTTVSLRRPRLLLNHSNCCITADRNMIVQDKGQNVQFKVSARSMRKYLKMSVLTLSSIFIPRYFKLISYRLSSRF